MRNKLKPSMNLMVSVTASTPWIDRYRVVFLPRLGTAVVRNPQTFYGFSS